MTHIRFELLRPLLLIVCIHNSLIFADYQPRFTPLSTAQIPNTEHQQNDPVKTTPYVPNVPTQQKTITYIPTTPVAVPSAPQTETRKVESTDPVELFNQATELLQSGKTDDAIERYKASIKRDGTIPQSHFNLGIAYTTKNNLPEAIECFTKAVELKPDYAKAHLQLAKLLQKKD